MRYTIFSGTNTWRECAGALGALAGSGPLQEGPETAEYERLFARAAGTRYAFSLAAGRMALYRILEALDIGPGDEVLLPAFTCVVVPNAILYRGARPVFVDIEPEGFNMDPAGIERLVTPRTKAVIAQHTFGLLCDIERIGAIARSRGLTVIEDCAHALGAERGGRKAGSLGRVALFSTDHSKVISTSTGGMITTDDEGLAARLRALQDRTPFLERGRIRRILATFAAEHVLLAPAVCEWGRWAHKAASRLRLPGYFYDELQLERPTAYPFPARLSAAQARIGISQLELLPGNLAHRRAAAAVYARALGVEPRRDPSDHAYLRYTFMVEDRRAWVSLFGDMLDMCVWFTSVAEGRTSGLEKIGYRPGSCPRAERAAAHCVNLPTHPRVLRPEDLADRARRALADPSGRYRLLA